MTANLAAHYLVLFTLAVLLEAPAYLLMFWRRIPTRRLLLAAGLVNLITNPLSNFLYLMWDTPIALLELVVVLAEAGLLLVFLRCSVGRAAALSLVANLTSWLLGGPLYTSIMRLIARVII